MKVLGIFIIIAAIVFALIQYAVPHISYPWDMVVIVLILLVALAYLGRSLK